MQIKEMFRKEIDRELQGVIVVGQGAETNVAQELEEYVGHEVEALEGYDLPEAV